MQSQMREEETSLLIGSGGNTTNMSVPGMTDTPDGRRSMANEVANNGDAAKNLDFEAIRDVGGMLSSGRKFLSEAASASIKEVALLPAAGIEPVLEAADFIQQQADGYHAAQQDPEHRKEAAPSPSTH